MNSAIESIIIDIITEFYNIKIDANIINNNIYNIKSKIDEDNKKKFIEKINNYNSNFNSSNYKLKIFDNDDIKNAFFILENENKISDDQKKKLTKLIYLYDQYLSEKLIDKLQNEMMKDNKNLTGGYLNKITLFGRKRNIYNNKGKLCVKINNELVSLKKAQVIHKKYIQKK